MFYCVYHDGAVTVRPKHTPLRYSIFNIRYSIFGVRYSVFNPPCSAPTLEGGPKGAGHSARFSLVGPLRHQGTKFCCMFQDGAITVGADHTPTSIFNIQYSIFDIQYSVFNPPCSAPTLRGATARSQVFAGGATRALRHIVLLCVP